MGWRKYHIISKGRSGSTSVGAGDTKLERLLLVFWINFLSQQKEDMVYKIVLIFLIFNFFLA
jgi:hypothetical protein